MTDFVTCVFVNALVPKSQPIAYAQAAFYLHHLGDTDAVTTTIKVLLFTRFSLLIILESHICCIVINE